jgi:phosphocarrier protein FPr
LLGIEAAAVVPSGGGAPPAASIELVLYNEHGLHARPAARVVEMVRRFDADVTVRNIAAGTPGVSARSVSALSTLGVQPGQPIEVAASGRQAREALTAVAALVRRNFDESVAGPPSRSAATGGGPIAASPGIGIGPKTTLAEPAVLLIGTEPAVPEAERDRLQAAIEAARSELHATRDRVAGRAGEHEAEIFDAHLLLLDDEDLAGAALGVIAQVGVSAAQAWRDAVDALAARFTALEDPYLQERAADVRAVGQQVLGHLLGHTPTVGSLAGVVVAADLAPSQAARLDPGAVHAVVTAFGSATSHAAILARSLGIPAVVGVGQDVLAVPDGTTIVVDGTEGIVLVDPDPAVTTRYRQELAAQSRQTEALLLTASRPAVTTEGVTVHVLANIASRDDAAQSVLHGADAVGLLRTEVLFLDRLQPPDEDEQVAAYLSIAEVLGDRRLTVRTLDVGGDKPLPYLSSPSEANPFLGCRGLRLSLQHVDLFKQQLRAVVRAGFDHPISVLFPMVSTLDELRTARGLLVDAAAEVGCPANSLPPGFEVGAMVEVPSFALHARAGIPLVDFVSIGTNDLTQYTLAAERGNATVAALADPLDPAVLRLISEVAAAATARARVAVCGEVAADPAAAALLVGLGVRELSMSPPAVPAVKDAVRSLSVNKAQQLATLALQRDSAASVRALLNDLT